MRMHRVFIKVMLYCQQNKKSSSTLFHFLLDVEVVAGDTWAVVGLALEVTLVHLQKMSTAFSVVTCPLDTPRMLHLSTTLWAKVIMTNR